MYASVAPSGEHNIECLSKYLPPNKSLSVPIVFGLAAFSGLGELLVCESSGCKAEKEENKRELYSRCYAGFVIKALYYTSGGKRTGDGHSRSRSGS